MAPLRHTHMCHPAQSDRHMLWVEQTDVFEQDIYGRGCLNSDPRSVGSLARRGISTSHSRAVPIAGEPVSSWGHISLLLLDHTGRRSHRSSRAVVAPTPVVLQTTRAGGPT